MVRQYGLAGLKTAWFGIVPKIFQKNFRKIGLDIRAEWFINLDFTLTGRQVYAENENQESIA